MISFKRSSDLQTDHASASSITLGLEGTSDAREARFWAQRFSLGINSISGLKISCKKKKHGYPRSILFDGPSSSNAIIQQALFGPPAFGGSPPLAIVSGPRVGLYYTSGTSPLGRALRFQKKEDKLVVNYDRQIGTGGHPALCASFRADGRLLAIGTDVGHVRVADATSRVTLTTFECDSKLPVRTLNWLRNGKQIVAAGDDGMIRLWNLDSLEKKIAAHTWTGHGDSVRCLAVWQSRSGNSDQIKRDIIFSGSYDHTIRVWDLLTEKEDEDHACLGIMNHGAPVEALLLMTKNSEEATNATPWLLSAGGTKIKVWNFFSGQCHATIETRHSKTITALTFMSRRINSTDNESSSELVWRILTAGLDGLIRIHTWSPEKGHISYIHGIKMQAPITSLAFDQFYFSLIIGTTSGTVIFRQQQEQFSEERSSKRKLEKSDSRIHTQGQNVQAQADDFIVADSKRRKLQEFDYALKQFRYGDALDEALNTRHPQAVLAVLEELGRRDRGLQIALSNRDEETLEPLLSFLVRYICRPKYSSALIGVTHRLCDIYSGMIGQSELLDDLFGKLKGSLREEIVTQKGLLRISGILDALTVIQQEKIVVT